VLELTMRIFASLLILFLFCGRAHGSEAPDALTLKSGGSIFEGRFKVQLSAAGQLDVAKSATPNSRARSIKRKLTRAQSGEIFLLASQSIDFRKGCGQVADGTNAGMTVTYGGINHSFSCQGAAKWPRGAATRKLLSAINRHLPAGLRVF
jgi:hypothetical protein